MNLVSIYQNIRKFRIPAMTLSLLGRSSVCKKFKDIVFKKVSANLKINKYTVMVVWLTIALSVSNYAQTYVPIAVTGFNQDIIAEGSGGTNRAFNTTTTNFDNYNCGGDNVIYSTSFRGNNNPTSSPPFGLPTNGIISSVNLIGASYQLASYSENNTLLLVNSGSVGTLSLGTPGVFSRITFLGSSEQFNLLFMLF